MRALQEDLRLAGLPAHLVAFNPHGHDCSRGAGGDLFNHQNLAIWVPGTEHFLVLGFRQALSFSGTIGTLPVEMCPFALDVGSVRNSLAVGSPDWKSTLLVISEGQPRERIAFVLAHPDAVLFSVIDFQSQALAIR